VFCCQFLCYLRHFSAFYRVFARPRPPIWHHFDAIFGHFFQKITIFLIFSIIFGYTYMVLGRRAVVLAIKCLDHWLSFVLCPKTRLGLKFARNSKNFTFLILSSSQMTWKVFNCVCLHELMFQCVIQSFFVYLYLYFRFY